MRRHIQSALVCIVAFAATCTPLSDRSLALKKANLPTKAKFCDECVQCPQVYSDPKKLNACLRKFCRKWCVISREEEAVMHTIAVGCDGCLWLLLAFAYIGHVTS